MSQKTYSELNIGDSYTFEEKITENNVNEFSKLTGDDNPLHTDETYANNTEFKEKIAHGMFVSSFFSKLIGVYLPGKYSLYLSQNLKFHKPIKVGSSVIISGKIIQKIDSVKTVKIETEAKKKESGEILISGEALVKLLK